MSTITLQESAVIESVEMSSSNLSINPARADDLAPKSSTSSSSTADQTLQLKSNGNTQPQSAEKPVVAGEKGESGKGLRSVSSFLPLKICKKASLTYSTVQISDSKPDNDRNREDVAGSKFNIRKTNQASKKGSDKISARRERKATKTLAIVLGNIPLY